jgi:hypothetical protein
MEVKAKERSAHAIFLGDGRVNNRLDCAENLRAAFRIEIR